MTTTTGRTGSRFASRGSGVGAGRRASAGTQSVAGRYPPHDLDAEAAVLSAILLAREALDCVLEILQPEHFYSDANGRIYRAAVELSVAGTPVDVTTVASWLRARETLGRVGGAAYIAQIVDATPAIANVAAHARVVHAKWRLRRLIATCQRIAAEGYGDVGEAQDFLDQAEQAVYDVARAEQKNPVRKLGTSLQVAFAQICAAADGGHRIVGVPTGYGRLDAKTAGLHPGDLTVLAARPGMGKTSFALNIAVNVAAGVPGADPQEAALGVVVFSLEMPHEQVSTRMACAEGRVDVGKLRQGMLTADDWSRLTEASRYLSILPVWIDDTPALGMLEMRAKVRRIQAEYCRPGSQGTAERKIGLVIVDYLQLMTGREGAGHREQEISEISRGLKQLAKELGVAVIALSQLNREVEKRATKDKRPQLSDIRESGAIEQDADTILFIYRDDYYHPETTNRKGIAELLIAKQRNGPTGKVLVRYLASCTRFDELAAHEVVQEESP